MSNFIVKKFLLMMVELYDLPINAENETDYKKYLEYITDPEMWGFAVSYRYVREACCLLEDYYPEYQRYGAL